MAKRRFCKECGISTMSKVGICGDCLVDPHVQAIVAAEIDDDVMRYNEAMEDYRDEIGLMHARSDDDGWAYADDPGERRADPSPMRILREGQ